MPTDSSWQAWAAGLSTCLRSNATKAKTNRGPRGGEDAGAEELQGGLGWERSRLTPGTSCSAHQTAEIPIACRRTPVLLGSRPRQPAGFSPGTWGIRSGRHLAKSPGRGGLGWGKAQGMGNPPDPLCVSQPAQPEPWAVPSSSPVGWDPLITNARSLHGSFPRGSQRAVQMPAN